MATSLQRISLKAEEDKQYAAAVGAQKMLYELWLRRKMDHEAAKASRPGGVIDTATPVLKQRQQDRFQRDAQASNYGTRE